MRDIIAPFGAGKGLFYAREEALRRAVGFERGVAGLSGPGGFKRGCGGEAMRQRPFYSRVPSSA